MNADVVTLSVASKTVSADQQSIVVTASQVEILQILASHYPLPVSMKAMVASLWTAGGPDSATNIISVQMCRLRQKISDAGMRPIVGMRGFIAIRPMTVVSRLRNRAEITADLLEDIAGLLNTHPDRLIASDVLARLPMVMA